MLFKNQYYYFISGLPELAFDSVKLPFTTGEFKKMLDEVLEPEDKKLLNRYFLAHDNRTLLRALSGEELKKDAASNTGTGGILSPDEIDAAIQQVRDGDDISREEIPPY